MGWFYGNEYATFYVTSDQDVWLIESVDQPEPRSAVLPKNVVPVDHDVVDPRVFDTAIQIEKQLGNKNSQTRSSRSATMDDVIQLLQVGTEVETPDGPGVVVDVIINAAQYQEWELDPPTIVVELQDGTEIYTCLCSVEIPGEPEATDLLHREYERLWPPRDESTEPEERTAMVIKPQDKIWLVTIPQPGHDYLEYPSVDDLDSMIHETTFDRLRLIYRGMLPRDLETEESFIATTYEEAMEIVWDYFPELEP